MTDGASAEEDDMIKDRWRELRRPVVRMRDALPLGQLTVAGEPLTSVTACKLEGYVKFGLGEK